MSIYQSEVGIEKELVVILSAEERKIIVEAIAQALPQEEDILTGWKVIEKIIRDRK
ncbi:TPA: hypothetical protein TU158_001741 [Streptococcus equi subsp. zooepidemicus]|nr:hypothetical protein [Streptococcus equi subsp. zooepidemicus]HEL1253899.1 hypothetical protein [Streptococcus equi subsp. zooepidemicus]